MKIYTNNIVKKWLSHKENPYTNPSEKEGIVSMNLGECIFPIKIFEEIVSNVDFSLFRTYPARMHKLKEALASRFGINENMIVLGNGSDEIIENIPRVFLNSNDKVLIVVPTFFRFLDASRKVGAKICVVKTIQENNFQITDSVVNQILKQVRKKNVRLIWLCSPNNPTGIPIEPNTIQKIASKTNALIVLDQVYAELQENAFIESKKLIKRFPNIIVLNSFSKIFGLAGIRVGFAIANQRLAKKLEMCRIPFPISSISLNIAEKILERDTTIVKSLKNMVKKEREFVIQKLKQINDIELVEGSQTNLILFRHKTKNIYKELLKRNILTADFNQTKGIENMGFVRISVGVREKNIILIQTLQEIFSLSPSDSERKILLGNLYERG